MRAIIPKQELNYIVNRCVGVVPQNPTMAILSNFLIEAKDGELRLSCSDLKLEVSAFAEAKILQEGKFCVSAKSFAALIREIKSVNIDLSYDDAEAAVHIQADDSKFKLRGMNPNGYPLSPGVSGAATFKASEGVFKNMLYRTAFAVSRDEEERIELTGVYMSVRENELTFMGTDAKKLSRTNMPVEAAPGFSGECIIPLKAVDEIVRCLENNRDSIVKCYLMEKMAAFETDRFFIITKLIEKAYPDFRMIIPQKTENSVLLHKEELTTLLRQVALFSSEDMYSVRFTFDRGELKLTTNVTKVGEGRVSMPANWQGPKIDIAFNPNYFLDILKHCENETVVMSLIDSYNPGVISDTDREPTSFDEVNSIFVMMPMNLSKIVSSSAS